MLWYAHGDKAPSARRTNDLELYELALDMKKMPGEIRWLKKNSPRDYWHLVTVNQARKLGARQIAMNNKIEATLPLIL